MKKTIKSENPNWNIPDRRLGKYLKKYLKQQGKANEAAGMVGDADDDESVSSQASFARKAALVTRKSFKRLTKRSSNNTAGVLVNDDETEASVTSQVSMAKKARQGLTKFMSAKSLRDKPGAAKTPKKKRGLSFRKKPDSPKETTTTTTTTITTAPSVVPAVISEIPTRPPPTIQTEVPPVVTETLDAQATNLLSPVTTDGDMLEDEADENLLPDTPAAPEENGETPQLEFEPDPADVVTESPAKSRDILYEDNNDGKKEDGLCTGCVIL